MEVGRTLLILSTFHCQILKVVTTGFALENFFQDQHLTLDSRCIKLKTNAGPVLWPVAVQLAVPPALPPVY